nr:MAG TPA: hypothetical protein [Caudoviricetes sp.]
MITWTRSRNYLQHYYYKLEIRDTTYMIHSFHRRVRRIPLFIWQTAI